MISLDDLNPAQPRDLQGSRRADPSSENRARNANARLTVAITPITSLLAVGFLGIGIWSGFSESTDGLLQRMSLATALFFLFLRLTIGHFSWARRNSHAITTITAVVAVSYPIIKIWLAKDLWATNYVALVIVIAGFLYASRVWLLATLLVICVGWGVVAWPMLAGEHGVEVGTVVGAALVCSIAHIELRLRRLARFEKESVVAARPTTTQVTRASKALPTSSPNPASQPWCPVCKASRDAIIRHDGEMIVDANPAATNLLGMSVSELAVLPVVGIFSPDKRDALAPIVRLGNFQPFETIAASFNDECIPVEVLNGGASLESGGSGALLLRDLRAEEKIRQSAAGSNRRAQQLAFRIRELSTLASGPKRETLDPYLSAFVKSAHRWLPCSIGCFVVLWDNEVQGFSTLASSASLALQTQEISLATSEGLVAHLVEHVEPLVVHSVGATQDRFEVRRLYPHEPVNAFCALPLTNADGLIGLLLVLERANREFGPEDVDYLALMAHCASSACNMEMMRAQVDQIQSHENPVG